MKGKRRRHDPEFKARVALEALKGVKTIQQIAKEFDIPPVQVSEWKKTMAQGAASVFGPGAGNRCRHPGTKAQRGRAGLRRLLRIDGPRRPRQCGGGGFDTMDEPICVMPRSDMRK
jgi:transposase-like protein